MERRKNILRILLLIIIAAASGLPQPVTAENIIKIGGDGSALGSMKLLSEAFGKYHPGVKVQVLPSLGSPGGINAALDGPIDIGLSGRPLTEKERKRGAIVIEYAKTPFIFATNKDTRVSSLSTNDLVEIYRGERPTWPDGTRIRLVLRPESDIDTDILKQISPGMSEAVKTALSRRGMIMALTNQESDNLVETITGSLGVSTLSQIISEKRSSKIISFNGVKPSVRTLADGTYPLVKPFYMVTPSKISAPVQMFIGFVRSQAGRQILLENGHWVPEERNHR
jgi:phosphate transport system substrate-binding protein